MKRVTHKKVMKKLLTIRQNEELTTKEIQHEIYNFHMENCVDLDICDPANHRYFPDSKTVRNYANKGLITKIENGVYKLCKDENVKPYKPFPNHIRNRCLLEITKLNKINQ